MKRWYEANLAGKMDEAVKKEVKTKFPVLGKAFSLVFPTSSSAVEFVAAMRGEELKYMDTKANMVCLIRAKPDRTIEERKKLRVVGALWRRVAEAAKPKLDAGWRLGTYNIKGMLYARSPDDDDHAELFAVVESDDGKSHEIEPGSDLASFGIDEVKGKGIIEAVLAEMASSS